jgi:hypothetical protein
MAASLKEITSDFVKLEKFDGGNFIRWQKKMKFLLTTLKVAYVLNMARPEEKDDETVAETRDRQKWDNDDYICLGHILNGMSDSLFDIYQSSPSAKDLWDKLETRYMREDATSKKFLVSHFNNYKMVDNKSVMEQLYEIERILNNYKQHNMNMDETIIVSSIIDKLPPSWKDFKRTMKHKKEDISLEQLGNHLRLEEEYRKQEGIKNHVTQEKVHVMEEGNSSKSSKKRNHENDKSHQNHNGNNNKKKRKGECYFCGKEGHFKNECRFFKKKNKEKNSRATNDDFVAVISEINMIEDVDSWWIDSGATRHVCKNKKMFKTINEDGSVLYMGNASTVQVQGKGTIEIEFTSGKTLTLKDVFYVPEVRKNLISVPLLNKNGFKSVFEGDKFILSKGGVFVGKGYLCENMFKCNVANINNNNMISAYIVESCDLWHMRLGHVNFRKLEDMMKSNLIPNFDKNFDSCTTCMLTKITRQPFKSVKRSSRVLDLIHSDVCDLHGWPTIGGKKYFVTFIDDCTRFCYVYLMHSKDEVLDKFKIFKAQVELQHETFIKCFRSDRGGEFYHPSYFESTGIVHQVTAPYTPQQNGIAERKNRTLVEMVNAMLSYSGLSKGYWGEAMLTACYILNRVPNKRNKITPYELWKQRKPTLNYLKVWGCRAIVKVPEPKRKKLGERGIECVFLGYAENSKAYRFLTIESNDSYSVNTVIESRDAIFQEDRFNSISYPKDIVHSNVQNLENNESNVDTLDGSELRRSKRIRKEKDFGSDFFMFLVEGTGKSINSYGPICFNLENDPVTYEEAIKSQDSAFWKEAIQEEMDSIMGNKTWKVVDLPPGSKPIGCKWIFKRKMKVDGTIDKFKARLVAKGFTQKEGIDYFDTYAPVARIASIRMLIALASIHKFVIHQMDVKTAFLNGELDEEVYMKQPEGFVIKGQEDKVCKLTKSLYGLKQAPKQWHQKFDQVVLANGYIINESDKCIYSKFQNGKGVMICLYVDDMLIFGTSINEVEETKAFLSKNFDMKDLGEADVILGIKIIRDGNHIGLSQSHYIEKVLQKFNHLDCKPISTPFDQTVSLQPNKGCPVAQLEYSKVIGCLMYAMTCTRPDIAYAVGRLSRYTSNPSKEHWHAVKRVLKYLKGTMNYCLTYSGEPSVLEGYTDASWVTYVEDHASTSGWIFNLGGGAVSWGSKKQTCIADSTMAAEFIALAAGSKEAEWLRNLLYDIPVWQKPMAPVSIHCDSQSTLSKAYSQVYNGKSRHIGLRHSYVRDLISNGVISIMFVRTEKNLADPLTKGLTKDMVLKTSLGMGLKPISN